MNRLNDLAATATENDCEEMENELEDFMSAAFIGDEQQQRILSSVMRKAGFEMKENITVKKTKRHGKRFVGFIAAAAVLGAGAVTASGYYIANRGTWNAVKYKFEGSNSVVSDEQINEAAGTIERITTMNGECEINTFEDVDITYEGTVADQDNMQMMFTIKRSDGIPFEEKDGYIWMVKYSEGLYAYENDDTLYSVYHDSSVITINEDGSLSLALDGFIYYNSDFDEYDYRLGFVDICYVPYGVWKMSAGDGVAFKLGIEADMAKMKLLGEGNNGGAVPLGVMQFPNKLEGEEYDEAYADWQLKDEIYENALRDVAEYYYSGEMIYRLPAASLNNSTPSYSKEQTGSNFEVTVSPQKITLKSDGSFDDAKKKYSDPNNQTDTEINIDVHMTDGSIQTISCVGGQSGAYEADDGSWQEYFTFEFEPYTPIKAEDIAYIMLNDDKIDING